jgi:predicted dinucleotide-binding enzyme
MSLDSAVRSGWPAPTPTSNRIAVVGAGKLGGTLGALWACRGHQVMFTFSRDRARLDALAWRAGGRARSGSPPEAARWADVLVLSAPWAVVDRALEQLDAPLGALEGKVLIDCTNPWAPGPTLAIGHTTSGAEQIASMASGARVVKGFSTIAAPYYLAPDFGGARPCVLLASDDSGAKAQAAALAADLGLPATDAGGLDSARLIEPLALLLLKIRSMQHPPGSVEVATAVLTRRSTHHDHPQRGESNDRPTDHHRGIDPDTAQLTNAC